MQSLRMKPTTYNGDIWQGPTVHPDLWNHLQQKDCLIELTSGEAPYPLVLGIPHHAGPGVNRIAEDWVNLRTGRAGRAADETTGLFGLAVFSVLRDKNVACKLVIAAHPTDHDPNKTPGSPYWQSIFNAPLPKLLLELHGAAFHRDHDLELSAGRNEAADPLKFGRVLASFLDEDVLLAAQSKPGTFQALTYKNQQAGSGRLQNPALETLSLSEAGQKGFPALHLEMKTLFRQPDPAFPRAPRPTMAAWQLAHALAKTLDLLNPGKVHIAGADLGLPTTAFLTRPAAEYEKSYLQAVERTELHELVDNPDLRIETHEAFAGLVNSSQTPVLEGLPEHPPEEYLWLIDQGEFIGRILLLHWLNDYRLKTDGQVDYWIRPSHRRQGYGRLILQLGLERLRQLGLNRVLISCLSENFPSRRIIEANGGIFESEIQTADAFGSFRPRRRYWIELRT